MLIASEAADHLGVSIHKVRRLVQFGHLPVYLSSTDRRKRLFFRADLDRLRPIIRDVGNDWSDPNPETLDALGEVHDRLVRAGIEPGPSGFDLPTLIRAIETSGYKWSVEREEYDRPIYSGTVDRRYTPGRSGHSVSSHAWLPEVSLARSLAELLSDEGRILTRSQWRAAREAAANAAASDHGLERAEESR